MLNKALLLMGSAKPNYKFTKVGDCTFIVGKVVTSGGSYLGFSKDYGHGGMGLIGSVDFGTLISITNVDVYGISIFSNRPLEVDVGVHKSLLGSVFQNNKLAIKIKDSIYVSYWSSTISNWEHQHFECKLHEGEYIAFNEGETVVVTFYSVA